MGDEDVCQYLNASSVTNINRYSIDKPHGLCPIEQTSIKISLLDNISPFLEKIENDFKIGLYYGLYIPAVSVLIGGPFFLVFSKYVGSPYHRNPPTLQSAFSLTEEEALEFFRSVEFESYSEQISVSVEEELLYRFIGITAIEVYLKYLLGGFGYDSNEINDKSQFYSITVSSIVFGLMHLGNENPQFFQVFSATVAGFYLGCIYCETGIIAPLTAHVVNNVLLLFMAKAVSRYGVRLITE
ncbi:CPBP family intramembrane glutamic endopeptidase [Endozoicomonas sp. 8E]|uniref:CPBP family intramembrane glutamic endopeptidase n=1 Tax=Endozoicomonas sp. 8E TaxID=3035692 RepID=UPI002938E916|nr:CPBP family intramembrane glutamic endopeptidase [Endozoicomonas sp. 8E]WOG29154.1 CPBP family intramembrane metalloprotease [Endozoicomonas sp. 8E]